MLRLVVLILLGCSTCTLIEKVNPYIGTDGHGYGIGGLPVGAQVPFGMVRLSPDSTRTEEIWVPWQHTGGYYYQDSHIRMFSHTHCVGAGELDYGTIGTIPSSSMPRRIGTGYIDRYPFMQQFNHSNESAQPGYYSVILEDENIKVELTSTINTGAHRFTYSSSTTGRWIVFDVSYTLKYMGCAASEIQIDSQKQQITGWVLNMGDMSSRFGGMKVYFAAQCNETFSTYGVWDDSGRFQDGHNQANGTNVGGYIGFSSAIQSVEMFVGISFISVEQAIANLDEQVYGLSGDSIFDVIRHAAQSEWETILHSVEINSVGTLAMADNVTVFYTALYHSYLAPTIFSEAGGVYLGFDGEIHTTTSQPDYPMDYYYTDMSIWDTFRTEFPWLALSQAGRMKDIAQSLVVMFEQGGDLPRWPMANGYTNTMIGTHADIVLSDAMAHSIPFDYETAYQGMYQGATQSQQNAGRSDIEDWINKGYVPYDKASNGCCDTLAYAYDDWCVSLVANKLGYHNDSQMFFERSFNFKTQWNPDIQFMCPRWSNGTFDCPQNLLYPGDDRYVEGDAWHYRWYAPQHPAALMEQFSSLDYYVDQLEEFFANSFNDTLAPYNILPNPYYWGGNEHDLFSVAQFAYAGRIDRTQYWIRKLLARHYPNQPNGLSGNDDYGALSSWALVNYLGLFPRAGDGSYVIGIPYFQNVTIHRTSGDIHIIANNLSEENIYVSKVEVNGVTINSPFLYSQEIQSGATIEFYLTNQPVPNNIVPPK